MVNPAASGKSRSVPQPWQVHRTADQISLMQIHVTVSTVSTAAEQPPPLEDVTLAWLQRRFSHEEVTNAVNHMPLAKNPDLSRRWTEEISRRRSTENGWDGDIICTRVVEDEYVDPSEINLPEIGDNTRASLVIAEAALLKQGEAELIRTIQWRAQSMHIFASMRCADGRYDNVLLGIVRAWPDGRIDVRPDFSPAKRSFFTRTGENFLYTLDVVENREDSRSPFERTLMQDMRRRRAIFEPLRTDAALARPPSDPSAVRLFYCGDVAWAEFPDAEMVAVDVLIKLPPGWAVEGEEDSLGRSSQLSRVGMDGLCHINLPIEFVAVTKAQSAPLVEVVCHSFASNARVVIGYGTAALPAARGCHELDINCWRVGGTVLEELRLMFLDAGLEIRPEVPSGPSREEPGEELPINLMRLKTRPTGRVRVRISVAMQSAMFKTQDSSAEHPMMNIGAIGTREQQARMANLFK